MKWVAISVFFAMLVAGCAQPSQNTAGAPVVPQPAYAFDCPPGASGEPCRIRFDSTRYYYTEPFAAAHPTDSDIWAIGAMAGDNPAYAADDPEYIGYRVAQNHFWFTQDGGATWYFSTPPNPPGAGDNPASPGSSVADPVLLIDASGVTHMTAIFVVEDSVDRHDSWEILYSRSHDYGRSWEPAQQLSMGGLNDRNWMLDHNGTLYVVWLWQMPGYYPLGIEVEPAGPLEYRVASSANRGDTWDLVGDDTCWIAGPLATIDGVPTFACRIGREMEDGDLQIMRLQGGQWVAGEVLDHDCAAPHLNALGVGAVIAPRICNDSIGRWAYAPDAKAFPELETLESLLGNRVTAVVWQDIDSHGHVHWIVNTDPPGETVHENWSNLHGALIEYIVFDPISREVLLREKLRDPAPDPDTRPPETTGLGGSRLIRGYTGDHYYGLATGHGRTLLAWTDNGGIDVTFAKELVAA